jgi:hypothetical protein
MRNLAWGVLGLMALGACAATPHSYEETVEPVAHDFRVAPPPTEAEEETIPEPKESGQFVSANGELCAASREDAAVVICGIGGQSTVVGDIISGSF